LAEIKYDIRRGADIYRTILQPRLQSWISSGKIKRGEILVWRSGLSGWRRAEELEELAPFFGRWEKLQARRAKRKKLLTQFLPPKKQIKEILIIDNEKDLCSLLHDSLNSRNYNIGIANTKREALSFLKKGSPDLIFLDLKLPDGDGLKLLPIIKKSHPDTIVNIISAYGSEESREEAKAKGAYTFIDKPFTEDAILRCIRKVSAPRF
jgi:CheY-like chemotaxis protein